CTSSLCNRSRRASGRAPTTTAAAAEATAITTRSARSRRSGSRSSSCCGAARSPMTKPITWRRWRDSTCGRRPERAPKMLDDPIGGPQRSSRPGKAVAGLDGAAQDRIEAPGLGRLEVEAGGPGEELGDREGSGAGEHRDGQEPGADEAEGEEHVGAVARERPQRLRGLPTRLDVRMPRAEQGGGGGEDDEVHHHVREGHAGEDVAPRVAQLVLGGPAPRGHRAAPLRTLLL